MAYETPSGSRGGGIHRISSLFHNAERAIEGAGRDLAEQTGLSAENQVISVELIDTGRVVTSTRSEIMSCTILNKNYLSEPVRGQKDVRRGW
ncbi:hypothetical protein [Limimaricola litoreus]|uniref:Uncharacterized protein n=1 Tax=Limimaricola litoreus TaxID=2955316 RepID=A0A9X2FPB1_9RHOB|nr:hypothetical protein [Limimaricola litoreus]MCP1168602.1 hypothetical protein [Limimaricola litoreus]